MDAQLLIDGEWINARDRDCVPLIDPATEEPIGQVPLAAAGDLDRAMDAMDGAWRQWLEASPERRGAALARIGQLLTGQRQQIAATLTREQGKTRPEALAEVDTSARLFGGRPSKPESGNGLVLRVTHHKYAAPLIVSTAGTVKSLAGGDSFVSTVPARTCPTAASRRGGYCYGEWEPFPGRPRGARTDRRIRAPQSAQCRKTWVRPDQPFCSRAGPGVTARCVP
jgi:hypothetical protein